MGKISEKAQFYAVNRHRSVNQQYDEHPYEYHLGMADAWGARWEHLLPEEDRDVARAIIWAHDTIEDTRVTYNDVKAELGEAVADGVYALTQEKGRNRAERESLEYFRGIRAKRIYIFAKLCDRGANVQFGVENPRPNSMLKKYRKDMEEFLRRLGPQPKEPSHAEGLEPMFEELLNLVAQ
jgi:(p)ppGpp synthase/HD superfamily hydrolase